MIILQNNDEGKNETLFLGFFSKKSQDFTDFSVRGIDETIFICIILRKSLV